VARRQLSEKLQELERELEKSQAVQRDAEEQITAMEKHLQAAHSRCGTMEVRLSLIK
jgi:predicted  nucleic acid-binding Zn-ribbon protein